MSTEKDSMLRVRLTKRQSDELDAIIGELQAQMPEASVTTSSIARYALEKYVSDHIAKRDGTKILIEINTADATEEDIKNLYDLLSKLFDETKENTHQWFITWLESIRACDDEDGKPHETKEAGCEGR